MRMKMKEKINHNVTPLVLVLLEEICYIQW